MKRLKLGLGVIFFIFFTLFNTNQQNCPNSNDMVTVGDLAPDFSLRDVNPNSETFGRQVTLSDYKGKVVLLYFMIAV